MERDGSPRRRHILASINREPPKEIPHPSKRTPSPAPAPGPRDPEVKTSEGAEGGSSHPHKHRRRLRLKDPKRHRSSRNRSREGEGRSRRHRSRGDEGAPRRRRRRSRSPTPPNPHEPPPLSAEEAFRESLFDAMADDEGAAYWEGVYGQPMHVYPTERVGPQGELEKMTDEEYAAYVRRKMWEKTNQGLIEERKKREEEREAARRREKERSRIEKEIRRTLYAGEERRKKRGATARWEQYLGRWTDWDGSVQGIPWPVESGERADVSEDAVKTFFFDGLRREGVGEEEFAKGLRDERVRWHPDKIQQRLGGEVEPGVMMAVTAIFQTVDKLWSDTRRKGN
ncbi:uncharacterized protein DNG_03812 [Cephalotrichum gorgonifer]|uniref:NF-kappa-B inhibitor-like protein 1 n=1 Tax=Cephalotrichum gorgonifer TaxID=2041049 RepID=A0AAE8STX8_9PEZI|nr:uncharacterized protein DNG_03812 [Cephalotrichum gorgonifer]